MIKSNREAVMSMLQKTTYNIHFNIPFNKREKKAVILYNL
jgi:hypothetical protein